MSGRGLHGGQASATTLATVVLCVPARDRTRFIDGLRDRAVPVFVERPDMIPQAIASASGHVAAAIVPSRDEGRQLPAVVVRDIIARFPAVAVIALCEAGIAHSPDFRALAAAGVHEFLFRGVDDAGVALRAVIESASRECAAEAVCSAVKPLVPEVLHGFVDVCVTRPAEAQTVQAVARMLGLHRKTLVNYCAKANLPSPVELLGWCRLMVAAQIHQTTGRTVESIALELDWASATALRNMMKRYTGMRLSDVRERGGLGVVAEALGRRIQAQHGISRPPDSQVEYAGALR